MQRLIFLNAKYLYESKVKTNEKFFVSLYFLIESRL